MPDPRLAGDDPPIAPDTPPEPVERPEARYPADAAADGITGTVRLKVVVGTNGRVEDSIVIHSSGDARLDLAATAAVLRWRYRPARRGGRPVPAIDYVTVEFFRDGGMALDHRD